MKKAIILLLLITVTSCGSIKIIDQSKKYHAYVKENKRSATDKDYSPYWILLTFWILIYGYTLTQPKE